MFSGILAAVAAGLTAFFVAGHDLPISLAFAAVCFLGCQLLYGSHRRATRRPKDEEAPDEETKRLLRDAYRRLDGIEAARRQIHSAEFDQRLASVVAGAEKVIDLIVRDPADLRRARKFLTVYLEGAERIAKDYARTHAHAGSADLEHNFRTLLVDLENTCEEQYQKLLKHDVSDLELQIEVLSTRLRREGVT
ncbi:MAG: 5-bromo-4-chloroindolyl phosphate hydrolysis family protein [Rhodospirillales bacterium]|nr:5-bromo-4-chloroindolyl phosphate hydrolysis family protein [Rhodospirillales bacterium]